VTRSRAIVASDKREQQTWIRGMRTQVLSFPGPGAFYEADVPISGIPVIAGNKWLKTFIGV
jgi:hypothetical protein